VEGTGFKVSDAIDLARKRVAACEQYKTINLDPWFASMGKAYDGRQYDGNPPQYAVTMNELLPNLQIKVSDLTFNDPEPIVYSLSVSDDEGEAILSGLLRSIYRYTKAAKATQKALFHANLFGLGASFHGVKAGIPDTQYRDPRLLLFDPDMADWDNPEWVGDVKYVPLWELKRKFSAARDFRPDTVRQRGDAVSETEGQTVPAQPLDRVKVYDYYQKEERVHILWAEQAPEKPLLIHEISDFGAGGQPIGQIDPDYPEELVIPYRFLLGPEAANVLWPHSYVELGLEAQKRKNQLLTYFMQIIFRCIPQFGVLKGALKESEKRKLMEGVIGEVLEFESQEIQKAFQSLPIGQFPQGLPGLINIVDEFLKVSMNTSYYQQGMVNRSRVTATEAGGAMNLGATRTKGDEKSYRDFLAEGFYLIKERLVYHGGNGQQMRYDDTEGVTRFFPLNGLDLQRLNFPCHIEVREGSTSRIDTAADKAAKVQLFQILAPFLTNPMVAQATGIQLNVKKMLDEILRAFDIRDPNVYYKEQQAMGPEQLQALLMSGMMGNGQSPITPGIAGNELQGRY